MKTIKKQKKTAVLFFKQNDRFIAGKEKIKENRKMTKLKHKKYIYNIKTVFNYRIIFLIIYTKISMI